MELDEFGAMPLVRGLLASCDANGSTKGQVVLTGLVTMNLRVKRTGASTIDYAVRNTIPSAIESAARWLPKTY